MAHHHHGTQVAAHQHHDQQRHAGGAHGGGGGGEPGEPAAQHTVQQMFAELDTNHDGIIDDAEFAALDRDKDGDIDMEDMAEDERDYISVRSLRRELAYLDERRSACHAGCLFVVFNLIMYSLVIDHHFQQENAYSLSQSLRDFVGGVSTPEGLSAESVATSGDVLSWVQDGLIDAAFSDSKYNGGKMALWERNYLGRYNKIIGGLFLRQHRYVRADPESPGQDPCAAKLDTEEYNACLKEQLKCGGEKFSSFYPVCFTEWSFDEHGLPLEYGPLYESSAEGSLFAESVVTQKALGEGTSEEAMCRQLATENNGKFCIACLKTVRMPGAVELEVFDDRPGSDCSKCKRHCLLEVAPAGAPPPQSGAPQSPRGVGTLTPAQVCGMCTWQDSLDPTTNRFSDKMDPSGYYSRGFVEVDSTGVARVSPDVVYGWETTYSNGTNPEEEVFYPACQLEKSTCLEAACERCIMHAESSHSYAAEKQEAPCSSLFSGGNHRN